MSSAVFAQDRGTMNNEIIIGKSISDRAAVWQGFDFSWSYNHRLNRFGNGITISQHNTDKIEIISTQSASTGTGPDRGFYSTLFSFIRAPGIYSVPVSVFFTFSEEKGSEVSMSRTITVPPPFPDSGEELSGIAVINGFDLISKKSAQKIKAFSIQLSEDTKNSSNQGFSSRIDVSLAMDCKSLECAKREETYEYLLKVDLLFIRGSFLAHGPHLYSTAYNWDRKNEPTLSPTPILLEGKGDDRFPAATTAIRSLSLELRKANWFIDWANFNMIDDYDPSSGILTGSVFSSFKAWREGMRKHSFEKKYSRFSFREQGAARLRTGLVLLQFPRGCTEPSRVDGEIYWSGRNSNPDREEALSRESLIFNAQCNELQ